MTDKEDLPGRPGRAASRRRWIAIAGGLIVFWVVAVWAVVHLIFGSREPKSPIEFYDKEPRLQVMKQDIQSVSSGGRVVCLMTFLGKKVGHGHDLFFDTQERRVIGITPRSGVHGPSVSGWDPDRLPIVRREMGRYENAYLFFVANALGGTVRRYGAQVLRWGDWVSSGFHLTPDGQAIAYMTVLNRGGTMRYKLIVRKQRDGERDLQRVFPFSRIQTHAKGSPRDLRWLSDNRTLAFWEMRPQPPVGPMRTIRFVPENLFLLDAFSGKNPRKIPVHPTFQQIAKRGGLAAGEEQFYAGRVLAIVEEDRLVRLVATFAPSKEGGDPTKWKSSIWDLDIDTGGLTRRMDLPGGHADPIPVSSPSGTAFVAPLTSDTLSTYYSPVNPVLYRFDQTPTKLPFEVPFDDRLYGLSSHVRFLDENTLIYVERGDELWKYDLRTGKSELLWRPE